VIVDDGVRAALEELTELAPLQNAPALAALDEARRALPDVPHVAVFDTAFHATIPDEAAVYAVPQRWREQGIRRYGFHGLSVQWASEQVRVPRLVVCHLGGGCSVSAVLDGRSVETTMGFSPLEGVPMATRSGSIDAEIVLHLLRQGASSAEIEQALEHESGLLGLSGISARVEELEASAEPAAAFALAVFASRVAQAVATCAVALGGVDALVFTGGVGERSQRVRDDVTGRLGFLGDFRVEVVEAREDVVAARAARGTVSFRSL
jgi:acetate kinase